jgi:hypothetical protein
MAKHKNTTCIVIALTEDSKDIERKGDEREGILYFIINKEEHT